MSNLFGLLPPNVRGSDNACISAAFDAGFALLWQAIATVRVLADLDQADERALDVMAHDLAIPDYSIGLSRAVKAELVKENVYRNKFTKGTAATVSRAVSILYDGGQVSEWQDTGGNPYTFAVRAIVPSADTEDDLVKFIGKVRQTVEYNKNARSHLDSIGLYLPLSAPLYCAAHIRVAQRIVIRPYMPPPIELQTKPVIAAWIKVGQRAKIVYKDTII